MKGVGADYSSYLHKYEAYRVPKNHEALKKNDVPYVESEDGSVFLLTEKAQKQLIKDRFAYGNMLFARANRAVQKTQEEAERKSKMDQLSKASNELAANMGKDFQKFSEAQKDSIVEADAEPAELSAIRSVVNLGGGIAGAIFDTVL